MGRDAGERSAKRLANIKRCRNVRTFCGGVFCDCGGVFTG